MVPGTRSYIFAALLIAVHVTATIAQAQVNSGDTHAHMPFQCLEDGLKSNKFGCLLLAKKEVAQFPEGALFWHLNRFVTREAAEAAKGPTGMVVEADGQIWLDNGLSTRIALFIVIHDTAQPWSIPTDDWTPTGACK